MSNRAPTQAVIYQCPPSQVRAVLEVLDEYELAYADDDELALGQRYLVEELPVGSSTEFTDRLTRNAPECGFLVWEDPAHQRLGTVHARVPGVGHFTGDCDPDGHPVWTSRQMAAFLDAGTSRQQLREQLGLTVLDALDESRPALPITGAPVWPLCPEPTWTVIGLYDAAARTFLVAGVVAGQRQCSDTDEHADEHGQWQRMAHHVQAPDADAAAYQVTQQVEDSTREDDDTDAGGESR